MTLRFRFGTVSTACTLLSVTLLLILLSPETAFSQENWPRFRGDNGTGVSTEAGLPTTFSPGDFVWNIKLPGKGHGSPIIWGNRLYITSASETGAQDGGEKRELYCIDPASGEVLWSRDMGFNTSHKHNKNSFASSTPCTDGEQVYVAFADEQKLILAAYTMDGELSWRRILGAFTSQHGFGVSPILYHDLLILPKDMMGNSTIMAFNKRTGDTVWSIPRKQRRTSYATPMILRREGKQDQLITISGASGISGHVPETGEVIWTTEEFPKRTVASPVFAGGLIVGSCGGGGRGSDLWAVSPDGRGDVTETHIRWRRKRELPYVPTPIGYRDWLFLLNDQGVLCCVEAATGENLWSGRAFGESTTVSSSMICIDGKLYCTDEEGNVAVIDAGPEFKVLGKSTLGGRSHATPAVAGGRLFFRTFERLMCLEADKRR